MVATAAQIAQLINGTIDGDASVSVSRPSPLQDAQKGDFSFLDNPKYESFIYSSKASIILVGNNFVPTQNINATLIKVENVRSSLAFLMGMITSGNRQELKISKKASIHKRVSLGNDVSIGDFVVIEESAEIGDNCTIYPQVFIGKNVKIGDNTILYPGVRVYFDSIIGKNCIIHANAVIGADGFGFAPLPDKSWQKVPHVGNVIIGDRVEIGACTCIDRSAMGSTIIHDGVKLDNLIHIAHNVEVGKNTAIAAQTGVAGSTKIGEHCQIGGQTGIVGHLSIADGTKTQAQSGLASSVKEPDTALFGTPAFNYGDYVRSHLVFKQLPDLQKTVRALEKRIQELEGIKVQ
jgi:UDP-3-O-[3-hydroxymyristoyl] glucosamine N-acyltransferase